MRAGYSTHFRSLAAACLLALAGATPLAAQAPAETATARGTVWLDSNGNGLRDPNERGVRGVQVSNGREVTTTDARGRYAIALAPNSILFITKPAGLNVPVDETNLPQFYFRHYPEGTPAVTQWRWPVIAPTGPLPETIDFRLLPGKSADRFRALAFADPQTANNDHLDMLRTDIIEPLAGNPHGADFAIVAGDVVDDNLALYARHNALMAMLDVPVWNVPGNHDLNHEAPDNEWASETFRSVFGPDYYSFEHGRAHVLALNNIEWRGPGNGYRGFLHPRQLEWIANDLRDVPKDRLIVILTHIPLITYAPDGANDTAPGTSPSLNTVNLDALLQILKPFRHVYGVAGHDTSNSWKAVVDHRHGWHGYPFIAHTLAEARGSGWDQGPRDRRGVRPATMQDGNPNGYYVLDFDGPKLTPRFHAAGAQADTRMHASIDPPLVPGALPGATPDRGRLQPGAKVVVNLWDGGARDRVFGSLDGGPMRALRHVVRTDPVMEALHAETRGQPNAFARPALSDHIFEFDLPADLAPGPHTLVLQATDEFGLSASGAYAFELTP
jgi:hypothetical protein